ncbi:MAG: UvrD-helicase domain-containing protein [Bacteroidota bacterium]
MSTLHVYRASAGSGKTHALVRAYIQLALASPEGFQEILAVTFTNQATQEMKQRILAYLHSLAQGLASPVAEELVQLQGWELPALQERAQVVLSNILHQYDRFSVSTIDSFFQTVVRGFAQELGLQGSASMELELEAVLDTIIGELIATAGHDKQLQQWLVAFAEHRVRTGKHWEFERELKRLGYELFTEVFSAQEAQLAHALSDPKALDTFLGKLRQAVAHFEDTLQGMGSTALQAMHQADLVVEDFAYGQRGVAGYLAGLQQQQRFTPTRRALEAAASIAAWHTTRTDKQERIIQLVQQDLQGILRQALRFYQTHHRSYYTALAVQHFIYAFGIITHLLARLSDYRAEKNVMLVSDTANLLRQIIAENDTPFVYEKIGAFYKHFLIDEFQDISGFQWQNLKPLLRNSLAEGHMSLLVGDMKQSIYRWRGGSWQLLLTQLTEEVAHTTATTLSHNWRSKRRIIDFNNTLFTELSAWLVRYWQGQLAALDDELKEALSPQVQAIATAYQDVYQRTPAGRAQAEGGYIHITFLAGQPEAAGVAHSWRAEVKARLPLLIESLQADGFALKDIALLVRNNGEGQELLQTLLAYQQSAQARPGYRYEAISAASLYLGHSPWVNILINALRCLADEQNLLAQAELGYLYRRYVCQETHTVFHEDGQVGAQLLQDFLGQRTRLQQLPLYELVETLVGIFQVRCAASAPFIQAFQDVVLDYIQQKPATVHHFLAWWQERGYKRAIARVAGQDAMTIMTIHQAKGLQFKTVILPFCEWGFDHNLQTPPMLWCATPIPPFADFPTLPVSYTSRLKDTVYAQDYFEERIQAYLDNLNLLYVAFTRPEHRLYVFAKRPSKGSLKTTADVLYHTFGQTLRLPDHARAHPGIFLSWEEYWNPATDTLVIGEPGAANK